MRILHYFSVFVIAFYLAAFFSPKSVFAQGSLSCYRDSFNTCVIDGLVSPNPNCDPGYQAPTCPGFPDCCQQQNSLPPIGPEVQCNNVPCIAIGVTPTLAPTPYPTTPPEFTCPIINPLNICKSGGCSGTDIEVPGGSCPTGQSCCFPAGTMATACPADGHCADSCIDTIETEYTAVNICNNYSPPQKCCLSSASVVSDTKSPTIVKCSGVNGFVTAIGCIPVESPQTFATFFLKWGMGIGGGIALVLIANAGYTIIASRGDPKRVQAGKELLNSALAGLVLLLFGVFILRFIGVDILQIPGFN